MIPPASDRASQPDLPAISTRQSLPFLTPAAERIAGRLKATPTDFQVEEIPAYTPCGTGEHLYLWVEKEDVSAEELTRHVARSLQLPASEIGVAGLKDRRALTRQYISVPARCEGRVDAVGTDRIRVLSRERHGNKLRTGHLRGNRFSIVVRGARPGSLERAEMIAGRLVDRGFPNYFGAQRYGRDGSTLALGWELLKGTRRPRQIPAARRRFLLRLALSAVQSSLFDEALAARLTDGLLHRVLQGDVMQVAASRGVFVVEDAAAEQRRFDEHETVVTGPMFGPKMIEPAGEVAEREAAILAARGVDRAAFGTFHKLTSGTRRPYVVLPGEFSIAEEPEGLRFRFTLPPGVYATTLLREFLLDSSPEGEDDAAADGGAVSDDGTVADDGAA